MANAKINLPGGVSVEVDGTPAEVVSVLERLEAKHKNPGADTRAGGTPRKGRGEIPGLIDSLKSEGFFKTPRGLSAIRKKLGEIGHHYPLTTLSGAMQGQVRNRNLRRSKQNGKYAYAQ